MKTAEDVVTEFLELSHDQQEKVIQFVSSVKEKEETDFLNKAFEEKYIREENYSQEDIDELERIEKEARQGINMSSVLEGKAAIDYLTELEKKKA